MMDVFFFGAVNQSSKAVRIWTISAKRKDTHLMMDVFFFGAVNQIRTGDLFLTKEVLCLLSYNSKMATRNGLEPSTSSVTG